MITAKSPCLACARGRDKNSPGCVTCSLRCRYVAALGGMAVSTSQDILIRNFRITAEKLEDYGMEEPQQTMACKTCGLPKALDQFYAGKKECTACQKERGRKNKMRRKGGNRVMETAVKATAGEGPAKTAAITLNFNDYPELLEALGTMARENFRSPEMQVLCMIHRAAFEDAA